MPVQYRRPEDGQPCGVEVAFMTSDVPAAFAAHAAAPIAAPSSIAIASAGRRVRALM